MTRESRCVFPDGHLTAGIPVAGSPVGVRCLTAYIGRHPEREIDGLWNSLPEKPGDVIIHSIERLFEEIDGRGLYCKSGSRVCTVAAGFAAVMHALFAMTRLMVDRADVAQRLHMPGFPLHKGVFATACVTRSPRSEQAEDREYQ